MRCTSRARATTSSGSRQGLRLFAGRVAIFAAHRGVFRGFACNAEFGDQEALRKLSLPMDQPSVLATARGDPPLRRPDPRHPHPRAAANVMVNPSLDVAAVAVQESSAGPR